MDKIIKILIALVFLVYNAIFINMFPENPDIQCVIFLFTVSVCIGAIIIVSIKEKK